MFKLTPRKLTCPTKRGHPEKERIVFQPSFSRGELLIVGACIIHVSNDQNPGYSLYIGYYTTLLCGDYTLGFQIPPEKVFWYVLGVQIPPHKVFGSLGIINHYKDLYFVGLCILTWVLLVKSLSLRHEASLTWRDPWEVHSKNCVKGGITVESCGISWLSWPQKTMVTHPPWNSQQKPLKKWWLEDDPFLLGVSLAYFSGGRLLSSFSGRVTSPFSPSRNQQKHIWIIWCVFKKTLCFFVTNRKQTFDIDCVSPHENVPMNPCNYGTYTYMNGWILC